MTMPERGEVDTRDSYWHEHGIHTTAASESIPEIGLLRDVAHAAWHLLDEGGESGDPGVYVASASDWQRLSDALDAAGWTADATTNAMFKR
jgi:hypothetical protein